MGCYGRYVWKIWILCRWIEGLEKIQNILKNLRQNPPTSIGKYKVLKVRDYELDTIKDLTTGETTTTGLPKSNVLYYECSDNVWACVRPSGTEPKIKVYFGVVGTSIENANELSAEFKVEVEKLLG